MKKQIRFQRGFDPIEYVSERKNEVNVDTLPLPCLSWHLANVRHLKLLL